MEIPEPGKDAFDGVRDFAEEKGNRRRMVFAWFSLGLSGPSAFPAPFSHHALCVAHTIILPSIKTLLRAKKLRRF
jgi:hypothetical protein